MKKVRPLFFVSLCFGFIVLVLLMAEAHAKSPGCSPVAHNLARYQNNLNACEDDVTACQASAPVPQTGQTTCWDSSGDTGNVIDCVGTGQDGDIRAGVTWPNPRFTANVDMDNDGDCTDAGETCHGTVTDNLTRLVWLKNANCFESHTWAQALGRC